MFPKKFRVGPKNEGSVGFLETRDFFFFFGLNICISNGGLKCISVLISTTPSFENKVICWYSGFTFETFIQQYQSIVFSWGIPILTVQECQSRFLILPEELYLRVPNWTAIFQDRVHQSFVSCFFDS